MILSSMIENIGCKMPKTIKNVIKTSTLYKEYESKRTYQMSPEFVEAKKMIDGASSMVDLGCGSDPHPKSTVAVDKFIEPIHRKYGGNKTIDVDEIELKGIRFVEADFEDLPFEDKTFDIAYSHHVVEHLDNPEKACKEMQRVARGGVILCPSIFAEYMFGRKYHKWLVKPQGNTLIFIEKDWNNLWFGDGPYIDNGKIKYTSDVNPFDILLNEGNWYHGIHKWNRLTLMMQKYWFGHYKVMETCFVWKDSFDYLIIYKDGKIVSSKNGICIDYR